MSGSIQQTLKNCCNYGSDGMHESLLGNSIPLRIHTAAIIILANSNAGNLFNNITSNAAGGDYTVLWEKHNGPGILPDCTYADWQSTRFWNSNCEETRQAPSMNWTV